LFGGAEEKMKDYRIDFTLIDWESPMPGVRQKMIVGHGKKLRLVEYTREMPLHWCMNGHYGFIIDGRFEIEFQDGVLIFEQGDGVFIPEGEEHRHKARALTDVVRAVFVEDI
jgi:quercetin dioxygenase-like cupin family protein